MSAIEYYVVTLGILACIAGIEALGFNLQFGVAGIINLAFIMLVAVGAYATAIASLTPPAPHSFETYIGGFGWPFPLNLAFGVLVTLVFSAILGVTALRRLRHDYLALTLIAIAQGMQIYAGTDVKVLDGVTGLTNVPGPLEGQLSQGQFGILFLGISLVLLLGSFWFMQRLTQSPFGRALRALRDDETGVLALGKNTWHLKFIAFLVGGGLGGLGGGLTVLYTGGWNPYAWLPTESAVLLAAIIVGGRGRNAGAMLGALVIMVVAAQASTFLPQIGSAQLLPALQTLAIGAIVLAFLWWRPDGILAEQRERFPERTPRGAPEVSKTTAE